MSERITFTASSISRFSSGSAGDPRPSPNGLGYEQPVKSISFGVTVVPGLTFNAVPFVSTLTVCDGGVQSAAPPLIGMNAFAPTEYSTLPEAAAE